MKRFISILGVCLTSFGCSESISDEVGDPVDECVFCEDGKADAFGIARDSYLAYGIVELANSESFQVLDDDVRLDRRAARGIVDQRPFTYIEQIDTVPYVGRSAFSKLAEYAQAHGFVPYCGDGELQPILERCDDNNDVDGDGCSSTCTVESNPGGGQLADLLAQQPDLIQGRDIGVGLVEPNAFYFRSRKIETYCCLDSSPFHRVLDRADGIVANRDADLRVDFDELAVLSTEPFYSSLFADEKAALADVWEWFKISDAPVAVIEYTGGELDRDIIATVVERPGPYEVVSKKQIADLEDGQDVARRLQQLPRANKDGDPSTIHYQDIEVGLEDYDQVFTIDELEMLQWFQDSYFEDLEPTTPGEYRVEFSEEPNAGRVRGVIASFDDYEFAYSHELSLTYKAFHERGVYSSEYDYDVNVFSTFNFHTTLSYEGRTNAVCGSPYGPDAFCSRAFNHGEIEFKRFDDSDRGFRSEPGFAVMEHYKDDVRIYNRVVQIKDRYSNFETTRYHNELATARPTTRGVTNHSFRKSGSLDDYEYQKFALTDVQTAFNRNLQKFVPSIADNLTDLAPGRYEPFGGVVLDVHKSKSIIAYVGDCVLPLELDSSRFRAQGCGRTIVFRPTRRDGKVTINGQSAYLYGGYYNEPRIEPDYSYFVLK